jgi:calcineurin-like phosphoesterase family protein
MKKLSFNSKGQKIWFVSDLHVGHNKPFILGPRNYNNVAEAVQHTFQMLHENIKPEDIVFNLGDMVCGAGLNSDEYAKRVVFFPCKHQYFLWGNHNAGIRQMYEDTLRNAGLFEMDVEVYPLTYPGSNFTFLGDRAEISIDGIDIVLDHYPIASWNGMGDSLHIHGHCHRKLKDDLTLKRLDVGWDWKKRPVEWNEIHRELSGRKFVPVDHHGKSSQFFE